jgi:hypothetical protein
MRIIRRRAGRLSMKAKQIKKKMIVFGKRDPKNDEVKFMRFMLSASKRLAVALA